MSPVVSYSAARVRRRVALPLSPHPLLLVGAILFCALALPSTAAAQLTSTCVRPLAIPDKWIESQTAPFDFDDTYDAGDVYAPPSDGAPTGYTAAADQGRYLELTVGLATLVTGGTAMPVAIGGSGGDVFRSNLLQCAGAAVSVGDTLILEPGNFDGVLQQAVSELIALDPDAQWDPVANDVSGSTAAVSPRVLLLPVFDTAAYAAGVTSGNGLSVNIVRFVGFFVSGLDGTTVQGYLTGRSFLTADAATMPPNTPGTFSATFNGPDGQPVGGVPIDFSFYDELFLGTATSDNDGAAELAVDFSGYGVGSYVGAVNAILGADAGFFTAASSLADLTIANLTSATTISATPSSTVFGQPVTFTATVTVPSLQFGGTVRIFDGTTEIGSAQASGFGSISVEVTTAALDVATHTLHASFDGTQTIDASTSADLSFVVGQASTTATLVASPNPSKSGDPVTLQATVAAVAPGGGTPTGSVVFLRDDVSIGSAPLVNGVATLTPALSGGRFVLTAQYEGSPEHAPSTSAGVPQTVRGRR